MGVWTIISPRHAIIEYTTVPITARQRTCPSRGAESGPRECGATGGRPSDAPGGARAADRRQGRSSPQRRAFLSCCPGPHLFRLDSPSRYSLAKPRNMPSWERSASPVSLISPRCFRPDCRTADRRNTCHQARISTFPSVPPISLADATPTRAPEPVARALCAAGPTRAGLVGQAPAPCGARVPSSVDKTWQRHSQVHRRRGRVRYRGRGPCR
jgi:hypothetical protein